MDVRDIVKKLHPLERKVLPTLKENKTLEAIEDASSLKDVEIMRALQWLENKEILKISKEVKEVVKLDKNGEMYLKEGLPERKFLMVLKGKELSLAEIKHKANLNDDELNVSLGLLKKKGAISIGEKIRITTIGTNLLNKESLEEQFLKKLPLEVKTLKDEEKYALVELKKRKSIIKLDREAKVSVILTKLGNELLKVKIKDDYLDALTPELLIGGKWKGKKFRGYDIKINVPAIYGGKRHFVNQAVDYIKKIWLELGFKEMTGSLVQTSFWDMDALFVPQDHPARDLQDTFYLKEPKYGKLPVSFVKNVKAVHETGWTTRSKGWQYKWDEKIAKENLLRTHTTVLSAKTIAKLKKSDLPAKFFSVGKVFRNESLSWKSLFEFYQVEGIVIDENANFRHLKGYLKEFFNKLGFKAVRIRPAHFPYTEPSAEVDVLHPVKKKWVELGGAGIFRPEVVKPLLGFECNVLAWGLGLERSIMEYYKIEDIRELYGNDLEQLKKMKIWLK